MDFQIIKINSCHGTKYSWRIATSRGKVLARSRSYSSYDDCVSDIDYVAINAFSARILDPTDTYSGPSVASSSNHYNTSDATLPNYSRSADDSTDAGYLSDLGSIPF